MDNVHDHPSVTLNVQTLLDERFTLKDRTAYQPTGSGRWTGPFRGARRGQGTEFDDLRHYTAGDDTRHIDWKASARTNEVQTRLYREEREYKTTFIIDIRDALFTGTAQIQAVRICRLAAKLLWQASNCGSKIQVLVVMDTGLGFSASGQGHTAAIEACGLIAKLFQSRQHGLEHTHKSKVVGSQQHNTVVASKQNSPDNTEALDASVYFLAKKQHKSGTHTVQLDQVAEWMLQQPSKQETAFWISAFDYCGEQFDQNIDLLFQRSKQVAIIVDDDVMRSGIPPGQYNYLSPQFATASKTTVSKNVSKKSILNRGASNALKKSLQTINTNKEARFTKLMMPMFNVDEHGDNLLATLRHQGYLP